MILKSAELYSLTLLKSLANSSPSNRNKLLGELEFFGACIFPLIITKVGETFYCKVLSF